MKITVNQLYQDASKISEIEINGWARTIRESKNFGFIELNDGTYFKSVQVVFERDKLTNGSDIKLSTGCALLIKGTILLTPEAKQPFEIHAQEIMLEGDCPSDYPLQKKRHSLEYLRTIQHLRARTNTFSAVFKVRSLCAQAIHAFFAQKGFVYTHTPIITSSDCEGAGEMFRVTTLPTGEDDFTQDFFGKQANLAVSGQLYGECFALAFKNIYTFGPTFRAEHSNTARHAAEFWMIEPEMAFANLDDNMSLAEDMIKYILKYVMENGKAEIEFFNSFVEKGLIDKLNNIIQNDFERITYTRAIEILTEANAKFEYPVKWGIDLQTEHERYLCESVFKKPVFVIDYPKDIKAFYMRLNDDNKTVAAMDLLVPGVGEIIGGSQREERYDYLVKRIDEMGLPEEDYWWYTELRKFGGCKHSGFGLGFERMIMYLTGMANIRDTIPFPRTDGSLEF